jgi:Ni/Fe-hydrogenase 1 B-type cytochrome subunit
LQCAVGFGLMAGMSGFFIAKMFGWVVPLVGGDASARSWHHVLMWMFLIFTIVHVYLVFFHDWIEGRGVTSSIIGGWKFRKDEDIL